jgi:hypothetical protein
MDESKQTFTEPKKGEEIASTVLAQGIAGLFGALLFGLFFGLVGGWVGLLVGKLIGEPYTRMAGLVGLIGGPALGLAIGLLAWRSKGHFFGWLGGLILGLAIGLGGGLVVGLDSGWGSGLAFGLTMGLILGLFCVRSGQWFGWGVGEFTRWVHDGIARQQHLRRQRLLKRRLLEQEWAGVPDGALSRARPAGEPEPTAASLSLAELPAEDKPYLTASVEATTEEERVVTPTKG